MPARACLRGAARPARDEQHRADEKDRQPHAQRALRHGSQKRDRDFVRQLQEQRDDAAEQPERAEIAGVSADDLPADFVSAMNDDVNVSGATAAIFTAIRNGNTLLSKLDDRADGDAARAEVRSALVAVRAMLDALGLDPLAEPWAGAAGADGNGESREHDVLDTLITEQLNARAEARKSRDFAKADAIRDALGAAGIAIEDGPQGSAWSLK